MKKCIGLFVLLSFLLGACGDLGRVTSAPNPFDITPSRQPIILTPTPNIIYPTTSATLPPPPSVTPSFTPSGSPSAALTFSVTPTFTETVTAMPPPTSTGTLPPPAITLLGCATGFDITHGMGEVTNAYVTIANSTGPDLTNACATLSSANEGRPHPDKTRCVSSLPTGYQVTFKLTIDTSFKVNAIVEVSLSSDQEISANTGRISCKEIGAFRPSDDILGKVLPIP